MDDEDLVDSVYIYLYEKNEAIRTTQRHYDTIHDIIVGIPEIEKYTIFDGKRWDTFVFKILLWMPYEMGIHQYDEWFKILKADLNLRMGEFEIVIMI